MRPAYRIRRDKMRASFRPILTAVIYRPSPCLRGRRHMAVVMLGRSSTKCQGFRLNIIAAGLKASMAAILRRHVYGSEANE